MNALLVLLTFIYQLTGGFNTCRVFAFVLTFFLLPSTILAGDISKSFASTTCTSSANIEKKKKPSLYLLKEKILAIQNSITKEPMKKVWLALLKKAEDDLKIFPDLAITRNRMKVNSPDKIPRLVLAYFITNDSRYLNHAVLWIDAYVAYKDWGKNQDLVNAHALFAMSLAYDWLYDDLGKIRRNKVQKKILRHANIFYNLIINKNIWWAKTVLQNHNYTNVMALAIAGVSLYGECAEAEKWLAVAEINFKKVSAALSPDGATHEGVGYWGYGTSSLLSYIFAVDSISPNKSLVDSKYMQNTANYRLHMSLPGFRENANYSDSLNFEWHGPGYVLRGLSSLYRDPVSQWLAENIENARSNKKPTNWLEPAKYSWRDLVWYDSSIGHVSAETLTNFTFFDNLGLYVYRTDWSDSASWLLFKVGPPQGWHAYKNGWFADSHIHPDIGQLLFYAEGKWLLRDDSYVDLKLTENHNVILVNEYGQHGEGSKWFRGGGALNRKATTTLLHKEMNDEWQYISADITKMYPNKAKLKRWERSIITLRSGVVIISDDLNVEGKSVVDTLFHLDSEAYFINETSVCLDAEKNKFVLSQIYPNAANLNIVDYKLSKYLRHGIDLGFYDGKRLKFHDVLVGKQRKVYVLIDSNCDDEIKDIVHIDNSGQYITIKTDAFAYDVNLDGKLVQSK